jgi:retron-type reverse transcriptase
LFAKVLDRDNLNRAYKRVKKNGGAPGVDGMTTDDLLDFLKLHGNELVVSIGLGKYTPRPVRRVEIPKPDGGIRELGVPTVGDRLIQLAIAQVLEPIFEPGFSDGS